MICRSCKLVLPAASRRIAPSNLLAEGEPSSIGATASQGLLTAVPIPVRPYPLPQ